MAQECGPDPIRASPVNAKIPAESPKSPPPAPPAAAGFDPRDGFFPQGLLNKIDEIPPAPIIKPGATPAAAPVAAGEPARSNRRQLTVAVIVIALLLEGALYFAWKAYKESPSAEAAKATEERPVARGPVTAAPQAPPAAAAPSTPPPAPATAKAAEPAAKPTEPPAAGGPSRSTITHTRATVPVPASAPVPPKAEAAATVTSPAPASAARPTPCTEALAALGLCTNPNNEKAPR